MTTDYRFQPKGLKSELGWYERGYIPHFEGGEIAQFLTFRLYDSMPQEVLERWRNELDLETEDDLFRKRIETYLDNGYGQCFLGNKEVAEMVQEALLFHNGKKYSLYAWVVMPNHIHILLRPFEDYEISEIAHSLKSFTASEANKILDRKGEFWQPEPFDRYIRNREHFVNVIRYIEQNPVKAGLCKRTDAWAFSSAFLNWRALDREWKD